MRSAISYRHQYYCYESHYILHYDNLNAKKKKKIPSFFLCSKACLSPVGQESQVVQEDQVLQVGPTRWQKGFQRAARSGTAATREWHCNIAWTSAVKRFPVEPVEGLIVLVIIHNFNKKACSNGIVCIVSVTLTIILAFNIYIGPMRILTRSPARPAWPMGPGSPSGPCKEYENNRRISHLVLL